MRPYSVKMAVLTSKITPIEKRCKIFELTKVNLLSLVELVFFYKLCFSCPMGLMVGGLFPLFFNAMPIVVLGVVRLIHMISVSETVRS